MSGSRHHFKQISQWQRLAAIAFAIVALLSCKIAEEIRVRKDGSGSIKVEITLQGEEIVMLRGIKEEIRKETDFEILEEGPKGDDYLLVLGKEFERLEDILGLGSAYSWEELEQGLFTSRVRATVKNQPSDMGGPSAHRLELTLPGKIVSASAGEVSGGTVVWDREAAGSHGELVIESRFLSPQPGVAKKLWLAGGLALVGLVALVVVRLRRRTP